LNACGREEHVAFGVRFNYVTRRLVVFGLKIGFVVVVPVLLYGSYPALEETERNRLVSNHRKRLSRPRKTIWLRVSAGNRLRDYVGAFVLAGLDPHVGSETDFFADRVQYYDEGMIRREKIRKDLQRYVARWPDRRFWLDGDILVEPQSGNRVRVSAAIRLAQRRQTFLRQGQ
jgi:hypothetical protein